MTPKKKLNALEESLDFIISLENSIEEKYRLAFELKHNTPESYAKPLKTDFGDERYQEFCVILKK